MPNPSHPSRLFLDTNAILRYLCNDVPEQANAVEKRLLQAQSGQLIIETHPLILAEALYVLESFYSQPRERIVTGLLRFLNTPGIRTPEERRVRKALERYLSTNVSFIDAFIAELAAEASIPVFSFDRGLDKFKDIRRLEK
jgi:predicted nucleic acid-binding protein